MAERDLKITFKADDQGLASVAESAAESLAQLGSNAEIAQSSLSGLTTELEGLAGASQPIEIPIIVDPDQVTEQLGDLPSDVPPVEVPVFADATGFIDKLNLELAQVEAIQLDIAGDEAAANLAKEQAALMAEALRYKQQLAAIENAGFSPEDAAQARATADAINSIRVDSIKSGFAELDSTVDDATLSLNDLAASAGQVIGQVAAIGASFAAFKESIDLFADADADIRSIDFLLSKTGNSAGVTTEQITNLADELSDATLTTESAVLGAANKLLSFQSITGETFTRAITLTQDLSQVMGGDLESNILQVAKALEDPARGLTALSRSGTTFTEEQQKLIKSLVETGKQAEAQSVILDVLEQQYGGAGVAAAGGLAGSLDTLGEEMNDLKRAFGEELAKPFNEFVKLGIQAINVFNEAPPVFQKSVIGATALAIAFASIQAAISLATSKIVLQTIAMQKQAIVATAVAVKTKALILGQTALALATGKATAAQVAATAQLGAMAAAAVAVAAAIDTFLSVTEETRKTDQLFDGANESLERFRTSLGKASNDATEFEQSLNGVQRFLDRIREGVNLAGEFDPTLNALRAMGVEIPKLSTAAESLARNQEIAFQNAIERGDEARQELGQFVDELVSGEQKSAESIIEAKSAIDAQIDAIKNQATVGDAQAAQQQDQIALLEALKNRLDDATGSTNNLTGATQDQVSALKQANAAISDRERLAEQQANESERQIQAEIRQRVQAGESIEDVENSTAQRRLAIEENLANERVKIAQQNLKDLETARAQETDPEALDKIQDQILEAEKALGDAQVDAASATTDRVVDQYQRAADERQRITDEAIEDLERLGQEAESATNQYVENEIAAIRQLQLDRQLTAEEAEDQIAQVNLNASQRRLDAVAAETSEVERLRSEGILTAEDAEDRLTELSLKNSQLRRAAIEEELAIQERAAEEMREIAEAAFNEQQTRDAEAFRTQTENRKRAFQDQQQADEQAFQDQQKSEAKNFQDQQQADQESFNRKQQAAAKAFSDQLNAEREKGNREFDVLTSEVERRLQLEEAANAAERQALEQQFAKEDARLERRRKIESDVLRDRQGILNERGDETELSPLEQAKADFESGLQERQAEFNAQQQEQAKAFQEEQEAQAQEFEAQQQEAERAFKAEQQEADRLFEDQEREIERAFQAEQQAQKAAFNANERQLDMQNAQRIAAILGSAAGGAGGKVKARAKGGKVSAGEAYLVGEKGAEIITPGQSGYVTPARQTQQVLGQASQQLKTGSGNSNAAVVSELKALRASVATLQPNVQNISVSGSQDPARDAASASYELARNDRRLAR